MSLFRRSRIYQNSRDRALWIRNVQSISLFGRRDADTAAGCMRELMGSVRGCSFRDEPMDR